jgi:sugar lactone lactonase YvrE
MLNRLAGTLVALAAACAVGAAQPQAPQALWAVATDIQSPESVFFDAASNALFVSNINGEILAKDGNGYISRLAPDGKVVNAKWAAGLNAPKGMRAYRGTLWVTDIDEVVGIAIDSGRITSRVKVDDAKFLNDLATGADGTIYASDSQLYRIYAVKDGKSSVFAEGSDVEVPNGLLVDGDRLILGTVGPVPAPRGDGAGRRAGAPPAREGGGGRGPAPNAGPADLGHLYAFDLKTKQRTRLTTAPVGGIDGIELDGAGGLIVSDVVGGHILRVSPAGAVSVLRQMSGPADIAYIVGSKTVVVPHLRENKVSAYSLADVIR